jgi:hypothetical protein
LSRQGKWASISAASQALPARLLALSYPHLANRQTRHDGAAALDVLGFLRREFFAGEVFYLQFLFLLCHGVILSKPDPEKNIRSARRGHFRKLIAPPGAAQKRRAKEIAD